MSAGICLLNKDGIVLAADSAVTIGNNETVYNSADKVFRLSKKNPLGLIMYQNTEFMNIPLTLIFKNFAKHLDENDIHKDTVKEYMNTFFQYLIDNKKKFHLDKNEERLVYRNYFSLEKVFNNIVEKKGFKLIEKENREPNEEEYHDIIDSSLNQLKIYMSIFEKIDDLRIITYLNTTYKKDISELLKKSFNNMDNNQIDEFIKMFFEYLSKRRNMNYTGITIAGFGENEIFPSAIHFILYGLFNDKIKYKIEKDAAINENNTSEIITLAQDDVMETFIWGTSSKIFNFIKSSIDDKIKSKYDKIKEIIKDDTIFDDLDKELSTIAKEVGDLVFGEILENNFQPIKESISILPTDELTQLAREMISLTSLRRKIILDKFSRTVGGPTDVALIRKIEGFHWIEVKNGHSD